MQRVTSASYRRSIPGIAQPDPRAARRAHAAELLGHRRIGRVPMTRPVEDVEAQQALPCVALVERVVDDTEDLEAARDTPARMQVEHAISGDRALRVAIVLVAPREDAARSPHRRD